MNILCSLAFSLITLSLATRQLPPDVIPTGSAAPTNFPQNSSADFPSSCCRCIVTSNFTNNSLVLQNIVDFLCTVGRLAPYDCSVVNNISKGYASWPGDRLAVASFLVNLYYQMHINEPQSCEFRSQESNNQPTTRLLCGYYACVFPPNLPLKHKERVYDALCNDPHSIDCSVFDNYTDKSARAAAALDAYYQRYNWVNESCTRWIYSHLALQSGCPPTPSEEVLEWLRLHWYIFIPVGIILAILIGVIVYQRMTRGHEVDYQRIEFGDVLDEHGIDQKILIKSQALEYKEKIGSGATAVVYRGVWKHSQVAIKLYHEKKELQDEDNIQLLDSMLKEASLMMNLRHRNIVSFYGVCIESGFLSIITEFTEKGNLLDCLIRKKSIKVSDENNTRMSLDCSFGMNYLHSMQIIHRDLKTNNLLVDRYGVIKVCDFGLSKFLGDSMKHTHTLTSCGTPVYAAPEVIKLEHYSFKADVYSFAVVMLEIWSRKMAWGGAKKLYDLIDDVRMGNRPKISKHVPESIRHIIELCWIEEPSERPDFEQVISMLETHKANNPSLTYETLNTSGRNLDTFS